MEVVRWALMGAAVLAVCGVAFAYLFVSGGLGNGDEARAGAALHFAIFGVIGGGVVGACFGVVRLRQK
jgi:hypothetical protein